MKRTIFLPALILWGASALAQQDTTQLEPLEVRATRASKTAPFAKTTISKKQIEKINLGQDLPFLLGQTPSVVINSDAGNGVGYTALRIRGSDGTRINVTMNGIPYNDAESHGSFFVNLPDLGSSINSIQIQRGVGTSSNGAGAFGASVNISTNEIRKQAYGEFSNSYGSFNTWKNTIKAGSGLLNDHFTIDARISRISSDGFIDRAASDLKSLYLSTAYIAEKSSLRFNLIKGAEKTYQAWNGILEEELATSRTSNSAGTEKPGEPYENETDNYRQDHYQLFFNHDFNEKLSFNTAAFLTRGMGYYEQYKAEQEFNDYGLPAFMVNGKALDSTDLIRQLWLDNYFYGNVFSLIYKQHNTQLTLGGAYTNYEGKHYGNVIWADYGIANNYKWYDLKASKSDFNVYAKWQQKLSPIFTSFIDLQYRRVDHTINGFRDNPTVKGSHIYHFFNPKIGLSYSRNGWNAYTSFSIGNKEPNRDDFEASTDQIPAHETLYDLELGIEKKEYNYSFGATLYYMDYKNQLVLTGKVNDVGAYIRSNIAKSYRMGIELEGNIRFTQWLQLSGNLAFSKNKIRDFEEYIDDYDQGSQIKNRFENRDISFSPSVVGGATLSLIPLKNGEIAFPARYTSRQFLDNTSNPDRSLDAYYVQDCRLIYTLPGSFIKETSLIFEVRNLFNKKYEPNGYTFSYITGGQAYTENYLFPMAGINWMLGVTIKL